MPASRFTPAQGTNHLPRRSQPSQTPPPEGAGTVIITSDSDGTEIFVDEKFFGDAPATLKLSVGTHVIVLKIPGRSDWRRTLEVLKGNKASLKATFDPAP
ncbi:MAG TPA: PEGA domain-containing protein [Candidatus Sulfotelmatobacter sp.]|nr:PEGA domain-containing protein [Candidatus Sulfotelmatobacter sp.]